MSIKYQKPFLKWIGGKTQIMDNIVSKFPNEINNYHEPFLGGGSVLLALLTLKKYNKIKINGNIYAYDLNEKLINLYKTIIEDRKTLYTYINLFRQEYDSLNGTTIIRSPNNMEEAKTSKESYYYYKRKEFNNSNENNTYSAALFLFINKTCFRGMYREGPNGYNVPYGHYKTTPSIITEEELEEIYELIKDVIFASSDFGISLQNCQEGDFVYLDPPYVPENATSFVGYTQDGFNLEMHKILFNLTKGLSEKNIKLVLSNSNNQLIKDYFPLLNCEEIVARRAINSKKPNSTTKELIIYN